MDEAEAAVVLRIFQSYADGESLSRIASKLNAEGVRAPYDALGYTKPAGRGWSAAQVRSMLRNERYVGKVVWNKREFYKDPTTKKRRARLRPKGSVICPNSKSTSERQVIASVMAGVVEYVQSPSFKSWVEEATAAAARALNRTSGSEELRLTAAVRKQTTYVKQVARRLIEFGVSDALRDELTEAEGKLRDLRRQLANVSTPPAQRVVLDPRQAAKAFEDIQALVEADPAAARDRLARYLEPVVLTPVQDEETGEVVYTFNITLKNETAAIAGGRVSGLQSCGGRI